MNKLIFIVMLVVNGLAVAGEKVVSKQEFSGVVYGQDFTCRDGISSDYSVPRIIHLRTNYSMGSLHSPSQLLLQNTDFVYLRSKPTDKCSDVSDLLEPLKVHSITGTKTIIERADFRTDLKVCQRTIREELVINVAGHKFKGVDQFIILPAPAEDCQ